MKITSVWAVAVLLLANNASAWVLELRGTNGHKLRMHETFFDIWSPYCRKLSGNHDWLTTKIYFETNAMHFTVYENEDCIGGGGYDFLTFQGVGTKMTINLPKPFRVRSYYVHRA
jgi:hypothetical protein